MPPIHGLPHDAPGSALEDESGPPPSVIPWDEMRAPDGSVRPHWRVLEGALNSFGPGEMWRRWEQARQLIRQHGVTWAQVVLPVLVKPAPPPPDDEPATADQWREVARTILDRWGDMLRERELHFVEQMTEWRGRPTEKQQAWLLNIAARFKGRT